MDLDGAIKLNDANIKTQQARVGMAGSMVDIAAKVMQIRLAEQQVIKAHLENVAKFLDIKWDAQAHKSLIAAKKIAQQKAVRLKNEAQLFNTRFKGISALLNGGHWNQVRDGWVSFRFFQNTLGPLAAIKLMAIEVDSAAYLAVNWRDPTSDRVEPTTATDPAALLEWARKNTLYPKGGTPAGKLLSDYLQIINDAAVTAAAEAEQDIEKANASFLELSKIDWERLK